MDSDSSGGPAGADSVPASAGDEKWLGGRKWTGIAAIAALALALTVSGLVFFRDDRPRPATSAAPSAPASLSTASGTSRTTAPAPDQTIPSTAPAGVTWTLFHGAGVPVSATAGPSRVVRSLAAGYEHSPTGALMAAANLATRLQLAPDAEWKEAVLAMAVDTPTRTKWLQGRGKYSARESLPGDLAQVTGFQVQSYSPEKAQIWITSARAGQGNYASLVTVTWQDDDWKLVMNGSFTSSVHAIPDLSGFVPWSGVS